MVELGMILLLAGFVCFFLGACIAAVDNLFSVESDEATCLLIASGLFCITGATLMKIGV